MSAALARPAKLAPAPPRLIPFLVTRRSIACSAVRREARGAQEGSDPRDLGRRILDDFAHLKESYSPPKHPIILAHGLLGFARLSLLSLPLPYTYFAGISPALASHSIAHTTTSVPPISSIRSRASHLASQIAASHPSTPVNIVAHSMGGLDARYMLSCLGRQDVEVRSLVTIATPHRGSVVADRVLGSLGGTDRLGRVLEPLGLEADGLAQLTRSHMAEDFNPSAPDVPGVRYFSYGAAMDAPGLFSPFRRSHALLTEVEGENDGLVSVDSSRWGRYMGTLVDVSHLDLINWSNDVVWTVKGWMGVERRFNAVAFYLGIADMLAKEGL